jgi:YVTN family beta-propeller protein
VTSPILNRVYIGNQSAATLSVINPDTDAVIEIIEVEEFIRGLAINSTSSHIYIGSNAGVLVLNLSNNTIENTIPLSSIPTHLELSPNDEILLVSSSSELTIINTTTNIVETTLPMNTAYGICINEESTKAYVAEFGTNSIKEIDLIDNAATTFIDNIPDVEDVDLSLDESKLYISGGGFGPGKMYVIDLATVALITTIDVDQDPESIQVDPLWEKAYTVNFLGNSVSVIDLATHTLDTTLTVGSLPLAWGNFILPQMGPTQNVEMTIETIHFYPNPTNGVLFFKEMNLERIEVYNVQGQLLQQKNMQNQVQGELDISSFPTGLYYIRGIDEHQIYTGQVLKK